MKKELAKISRFMSLVLRHKPKAANVEMDRNGWVIVDKLLQGSKAAGVHVTMEMLVQVVEENNKQRFSFNEKRTKIRANQGHSLDVDLKLEPKEPPTFLYHGTSTKNETSIRQDGLNKKNRQHVHLSVEAKTALNVGKRHGKPVILLIGAINMHKDGHEFYLSDNGVWLTDHVPAKYIGGSEYPHE